MFNKIFSRNNAAPTLPTGQAASGVNGQQPFASDLTEDHQGHLAAVEPSGLFMIDGHAVLFGFHWRPYADAKELQSERAASRKHKLYDWLAVHKRSQMLGLAQWTSQRRAKHYSAALLCAENMSTGGIEFFILQVQQHVAVIALVNGSPVPGYDLWLNTKEEAYALLLEFQQVHAGQSVSVLANFTDSFSPATEVVDLAQLVETLPAEAVAASLRQSVPTSAFVALGVLMLGGMAVAGYQYYEEQRALEIQRLAEQQQQADPNIVYEKTIVASLANAGRPGQSLLDNWYATIQRIPLGSNGWALSAIDCGDRVCTAKWSRLYGNFAEFDGQMPTGAQGKPNFVTTNGLVKAEILSQHGWDSNAIASAGLVRETLPTLREALLQWGSRLQDISLVVDATTEPSLAPPTLFNPPQGVTSADPIHRPVMLANWQIQDSMWSLPQLQVPAFAINRRLEIQLKKDEKSTYTLSGEIYAKGKDY